MPFNALTTLPIGAVWKPPPLAAAAGVGDDSTIIFDRESPVDPPAAAANDGDGADAVAAAALNITFSRLRGEIFDGSVISLLSVCSDCC